MKKEETERILWSKEDAGNWRNKIAIFLDFRWQSESRCYFYGEFISVQHIEPLDLLLKLQTTELYKMRVN